MKLPKNDKELDIMLKKLGRTPEQIESMKDFGKLVKALELPDKEFNEAINDLKNKHKIK